eukprot:gene5533-3946_t
MSVVLWPRQEVLQLVIPQLSTIGKGLHLSTIGEISRRLLELRNTGGKISLQAWLIAARSVLKWNDQSIYLFWDVLILAAHYLNPDLVDKYEDDNVELDVECIIVFLILHVTENAPSAKAAPGTSFDSVWPLNPEGEVYPSSPISSPSSPIRESNRVTHRAMSPIGSPRSPRNGSSPVQNGISPSKRPTASSPRAPRISTQHLHSVRQKIPIILRALSWVVSSNADEDIAAFMAEDHRNMETSSSINMFVVDRKIADFLGLVICGGYSRDQCISPFSALHPVWANSESDSIPSRSMQDIMDAISLAGGHLTSVDYLAWLNLHLSMNDVLYPVTLTPANTGLSGTGAVIDSLDPSVKDSKHQYPHRVSTPIFSLSRFSPTVINNCSTTIIHNVTTGPSRAASFRHRSMRQHDSERMDVQTVNSESTMRINRLASVSHDFAETDLDAIVQELGIPENVMDQDLTSPMGSPWKIASITGCVDSQIIIGGVYGSLIVNGCERVKITAACRKLVVINCLECEFNIATLSCSIVMGDSRNLSFGPHNAPYRNLRNHLRIADLTDLIHQPHGSAAEGEEVMVLTTSNAWSLVCDVNHCVDMATKPSGASLECQSNRMLRFSLPTSSTAMVQTPDQFRFVSIPLKSEYVNNFENLVIGLPPTFLESVRHAQEKIDETKHRVVTLLSEHSPDAMQADSSTSEDDDHRELTAKEWLVATDNIQEVLDLIRIDTEKTGH